MAQPPGSPLTAVALNCTLKSTPEASSTDEMIAAVVGELRTHGVETTTFRIVDEDVRFGVHPTRVTVTAGRGSSRPCCGPTSS